MHTLLDSAVAEISTVVLGKEQKIRLALCCLISEGHLLIEDVPGMGKTTLSNALARVLGLQYQRVQFTSDLLPADILGLSIFSRQTNQFEFMAGPIFTQVFLADEINRSTPKTQSALLEAMEERQVTLDGETRVLSSPFFVIATQNPSYQSGTYPLPESQLDRFLMRISLGYPDKTAERQLLIGDDSAIRLTQLKQVISVEQLTTLQQAVKKVHCSEELLDYLQRLLSASRTEPSLLTGLSPRGGLALLRSAKAWALMEGRAHVIPEDLQRVLASVVDHRLIASAHNQTASSLPSQLLLEKVPVFTS